MTNLDIAYRRLHNQHITRRWLETPQALVEWMGAVQAQDFAAAKWALGLRLLGTYPSRQRRRASTAAQSGGTSGEGVTDDDIEQAFTDGAILRTHVMRPTWHFVSPADIRWLLALTAPRVHAANTYWYGRLELDDAIVKRSNDVLTKALQGGKQLTRDELASTLKLAGIITEGEQRVTYIVMRAELDGIICSGARRGRQFTYALVAERAPNARTLTRDEALAELTTRYFTSHGPATVQDFVWWSGLTATEARMGLEMVKFQLLSEPVDGQTYWFSSSAPHAQECSQTAFLLPNFDEYTVGYTDRSAIFDALHTHKLDPRVGVLGNSMVLDGQVVGNWKRTFKKNIVVIEANPFVPLSSSETKAFAAAANRYGEFLRMRVDSPWL